MNMSGCSCLFVVTRRIRYIRGRVKQNPHIWVVNSPAVLVESLAFELIFVFDGSTLRVDVVTMFLYPFGRDSSVIVHLSGLMHNIYLFSSTVSCYSFLIKLAGLRYV